MALRAGELATHQRLIEREARVLSELDHPGIPQYFEHFIHGHGRARSLFLVQAFIDGVDLHTEATRRRYTVDDVLAVIEEVAGILAYLHGLHPPVIHRDIKPRNLMRRADGGIVLLDFGAVRDVLADPKLGGSTVAGTFGYMAPEQFIGRAEPATDLYALGVTAVVLLARRPPEEMLRLNALDWQPYVSAPAAVTELLGSLLAPEIDARARDAGKVRAHAAAVRAELVAPSPSGGGYRSSACGGGETAPSETPPPPTTPELDLSLLPKPVAGLLSGLKLLSEHQQALAEVRSRHQQKPPRESRALRRHTRGKVTLEMSLPASARPRSKKVTFILAALLGSLGGPFWYLGHTALGVLSVLMSWTMLPWIVSMVKAISVLRMSDAEFDRRYNAEALAFYQNALPPPDR